MNFTAKDITGREASSTNSIGFILGLFVCYPFEAHKYPMMELGQLFVALVFLSLVVGIGVAFGGIAGRLTILAAGFAEGAMVLTMIFPA
ncbi:MAG TPA: hypothetical protein VJ843_05515 [Candidatus Saccharimonadales bacterium]|nr:hypothetical protein [Candidatus Saccharimonadales bacterium]